MVHKKIILDTNDIVHINLFQARIIWPMKIILDANYIAHENYFRHIYMTNKNYFRQELYGLQNLI